MTMKILIAITEVVVPTENSILPASLHLVSVSGLHRCLEHPGLQKWNQLENKHDVYLSVERLLYNLHTKDGLMSNVIAIKHENELVGYISRPQNKVLYDAIRDLDDTEAKLCCKISNVVLEETGNGGDIRQGLPIKAQATLYVCCVNEDDVLYGVLMNKATRVLKDYGGKIKFSKVYTDNFGQGEPCDITTPEGVQRQPRNADSSVNHRQEEEEDNDSYRYVL